MNNVQIDLSQVRGLVHERNLMLVALQDIHTLIQESQSSDPITVAIRGICKKAFDEVAKSTGLPREDYDDEVP